MAKEARRWQQRLHNFDKAFEQLGDIVRTVQRRELSRLEKQGAIHTFEFTYELGWNLLRDYLRWQGTADLIGSRDTIREAFSVGLIEDGETWMQMLQDRNRTTHTYNEETAEAILQNITSHYHGLLHSLQTRMQQEAQRHGNND